jgi:DNA sulfur modification protein DndE
MTPPIDAIRLSASEKDLLIRIKRKTGIASWNVLCRWGLLLGINESNALRAPTQEKRDAIEIRWDTFAGRYSNFLTSCITLAHSNAHSKGVVLSVGDFINTSLSIGIKMLASQCHTRGLKALSHFTSPASLKSHI